MNVKVGTRRSLLTKKNLAFLASLPHLAAQVHYTRSGVVSP